MGAVARIVTGFGLAMVLAVGLLIFGDPQDRFAGIGLLGLSLVALVTVGFYFLTSVALRRLFSAMRIRSVSWLVVALVVADIFTGFFALFGLLALADDAGLLGHKPGGVEAGPAGLALFFILLFAAEVLATVYVIRRRREGDRRRGVDGTQDGGRRSRQVPGQDAPDA